jgi:hypothetical protein
MMPSQRLTSYIPPIILRDCMCIPLPFRQRLCKNVIAATKNRRIVEPVVLYAVHVVTKGVGD